MSSFSNNLKTLAAAIVLGVGAMAVVFTYHHPGSNAGAGNSTEAVHAPDRIIRTDGSFALVPDQTGAVGPIHIVFRGMERPRHLRMDVTIPELDPFYAYPYTIDTASAKNGFTMAGQRFRLLSANRTRIWLKWMGPSLG